MGDSQERSPAHWSKDFVEHLRTVHFALIATAAAVIIVALTAKPYSANVAKYDLHKIVELKSNWGPTLAHKITPVLVDRRAKVSQKISSDSDFMGLSANNAVILGHFSPSPNVVRIRGGDYGAFDKYVPKVPDELAAFQAWWDALDQRRIIVYYPESIDTENTAVFQKPRPNETSVDSTFRDIVVNLVERQSAFTDAYMSRFSGKQHKFKAEMILMFPFDELPLNFTEDGDALRDVSQDDLEFVIFPTAETEVRLKVNSFSYVRLNRETLSQFLYLPHGSSPSTFYDLRQMADIFGVESLQRLDELLSRSEATESPSFEAFGIKFPADLANVAGFVVILSVQTYFFAYLRKVYGSLKADDAGWDVPWIGMDSSKLAAGIFFTTVVVAPLAALTVLSGTVAARSVRLYRSVSHDGLRLGRFEPSTIPHMHWMIDLRFVPLVLAIVLSAYLGIKCWRYRPQLIAQDAVAQPSADSFTTTSRVTAQPELVVRFDDTDKT